MSVVQSDKIYGAPSWREYVLLKYTYIDLNHCVEM